MRVETSPLAQQALILVLLVQASLAFPNPSPSSAEVYKLFKHGRESKTAKGQCPAGTNLITLTQGLKAPASPVNGAQCPVGSVPANENGECPTGHVPIACSRDLFDNQLSKRDDDGDFGIETKPVEGAGRSPAGILCCIASDKFVPFVEQYEAQYRRQYPGWNGRTIRQNGAFRNYHSDAENKVGKVKPTPVPRRVVEKMAEIAVTCLELAGVVFKAAKVVKSIKGAPKEVQQKQQEIAEYAHAITKILKTPGLDAKYEQRMLSSSKDLQNAMHEVHELLAPLSRKGREGKLLLFWDGIKATLKKDDIKEAFDKVLREQKTWMGEVHVVLFSQNMEYSTEILKRQTLAEAVEAETLASAGRIENTVSGAQEEIKEVKEVVGEVVLLSRQIHNLVAVKVNQRITSGTANDSNVIDSTTVALAPRKIAPYNLKRKVCRCVRSLDRWAMIKFRFVSQTLDEHRRDCPYYESGEKRVTYAAYLPPWSVSWLPGLAGKSVTLGWDQSVRGGAYSISPILRMTRQVRREDSPVFKTLDEFKASFPWVLHRWKPDFSQTNKREAKPEDLKACIDSIKLLFSTGQGFPTDVDENGESIWQTALMMLEAALRGQYDELIPFLQELLLLLLERGAKPNQEYQSPHCLTLKGVWGMPITTVSYQLYHGNTTAFDGFKLPLYDELKAADYVEDHAKFDLIFEMTPPIAWRPLLRVYPEVLEDHEMTAIAERLLFTPTVEEFKNSVTCEEIRDWDRDNNWWHKRVLLGWPEIFPYLAEAGFDFSPALEDACVVSCVEAVRALLKVEHLPIRTLHLDKAFDCNNIEILKALVQEMVARRDMMCELASAVLEQDVQASLGLFDGCWLPSSRDARRLLEITLDEYQGRVTEALRNLGGSAAYFSIDPKFSDPETDERRTIERLNCIDLFEDYAFPDPTRCSFVGDYVDAMEFLLDAGFHALDNKDNDGETVLYKTCRYYKPGGSGFGEVDDRNLLWLLRYSSKAQFPSGLVSEHQSLVSPIFYAASFLRHISTEGLQYARVLEQLSEVPTDGCECFCSSNGCMPHYMFLRCDGNGCGNGHRESSKHDACTGDAYGVASQDGSLHQWCDAWALPDQQKELYYAEACRLEIFERLGMSHTCCASGRRKDYIERIGGIKDMLSSRPETYQAGQPPVNVPKRWPRADDAERREIQEEDRELKAQLDSVMCHYDKMRALFLTSPVCGDAGEDFCDSFWFLWWSCVDQILPPLGREKCVYRGLDFTQREIHKERGLYEKLDQEFEDKREEEKEAALKAAGYEGQDFEDVVDKYFGEALDALTFLRGRRVD
ncbi:hypothetical protein PpBr36_03856 [Pyricularia pennisetigena]|uniref:hypothetical protein n=1 Tax=Pyricularia pennisetigena TaxID=1578925 RepID=UPI001152BABC|nr:hypothetical protein PpBr36_03856 [Pyricularia pennisetigena]TLS30956.1 hypothetical protein PpBr36_03856 [Pyricularia pennisetigena]